MMNKGRQKPLHSIADNVFYLLREFWSKDRLLVLFMLLETIFGVAAPFFGIYLPKLTADLITTRSMPRQMIITLGSFTLAMAGVSALNGFVTVGKYMRYNHIRSGFIDKLFYKSLSCDFALIESAEGQTRYHKARAGLAAGDNSGINSMVWNLMRMVVASLSFCLYSGILGGLNPLIVPVLICTALINYAGLKYAVKYRDRKKTLMAAISKKINYIERTSSDFAFGKDFRVYGMKPLFIKLRDTVLGDRLSLDKKIYNINFLSYSLGVLTNLLRDGFAYVYLIYQASAGNISIGEFLLYFGAIAGYAGWVSTIINAYVNMNWASIQINDAREFFEQTDAPEPSPGAKPAERAPAIEFREVCFCYEPGGKKILDNFSLCIKPGEKVAIVGVNGAGKTTLIKLLCGFYKPVSGRILIDGTDIAEFKKTDLLSMFSAVFQDVLIMPFSIAENVAMCPTADIDRAKVEKCLDSAGLAEQTLKLPGGIDSPMLKVIHDNGIVLSGGQQQRLLLARALYKDAPILLLDEPTAALDPIAESQVYERYQGFAGGKTSVFISHRLASTRFCDRIIFMENGKPSEVGSHSELIRINGKYADMFNVQSRYYRENATEGGLAHEAV